MLKPIHISVCSGHACTERGSAYIRTRLDNDIRILYPDVDVAIDACSCQGNCQNAATVLVDGRVFSGMNPIKAAELLRARITSVKASFTSPAWASTRR